MSTPRRPWPRSSAAPMIATGEFPFAPPTAAEGYYAAGTIKDSAALADLRPVAWMRMPRAALAALALAVAVACLEGGPGFAGGRSGRTVSIVERDFSISAP